MNLISNNNLLSAIGKLYSYDALVLDNMANEMRDDFYHYILDYLRKEFVYMDKQEEEDDENKLVLKPRDYERLINNVEFVQYLKVYHPIQEGFMTTCEYVLKECEKVLQLIEDHLG